MSIKSVYSYTSGNSNAKDVLDGVSAHSVNIQLKHNVTLPNGSTASLAKQIDIYSNGAVTHGQYGYLHYADGELRLLQQDSGSENVGYVDIILSVTAQFPD